MRLRSVTIQNFRGYRDEALIPIDSLTAIVGRNDVGKSTVLEALDIFFGGGVTKIEQLDKHVGSTESVVKIGCRFDSLPPEVTLDTQSRTSLAEECLLNSEGQLEVVRMYDCSKAKPSVTTWVRAHYPQDDPYAQLHQLKNHELKKLVEQLGVVEEVNLTDNASMRRTLLKQHGAQNRSERLVRIDEKEAKQIGDALEALMPIWALFQADRGSKVDDPEIQDPMKLAIKRALDTVQGTLQTVMAKVEAEALDVARETVEQLKLLHPELASAISPRFKADPQWAGLFKIDLDDERGIPLNKRGSGVRRLVLLSFVRAEVERLRRGGDAGKRPLLLAIEEPETAQHPSSQRIIIDALQELVENGDQILVTTHSPSLAGMLPTRSLRFVDKDATTGLPNIRWGGEEVIREIANSLGVFADAAVSGVRVALVVEGPTDEMALISMSKVLNDAGLISFTLEDPCPEVFVVLGGGETLTQWVERNQLDKLGVPQVHIYDSDRESSDAEPKAATVERQSQVSAKGGCVCFVTNKREIENYLHPDVFSAVTTPPIAICLTGNEADYGDIPALIANQIFPEIRNGHTALKPELIEPNGGEFKLKARKAKEFAARLLFSCMSADQLLERGRYVREAGAEGNEILEWFAALGAHLAPTYTPMGAGAVSVENSLS